MEPIVMIGDHLNVSFSSTKSAKSNLGSLNQWGYKLYIKPIKTNQLVN